MPSIVHAILDGEKIFIHPTSVYLAYLDLMSNKEQDEWSVCSDRMIILWVKMKKTDNKKINNAVYIQLLTVLLRTGFWPTVLITASLH